MIETEAIPRILILCTGGGSLRTAEISKNHIKSTKMAVQKLSPPIERSRREEFGKNAKKNRQRFGKYRNSVFSVSLAFRAIN